jgi:hypothetical protein
MLYVRYVHLTKASLFIRDKPILSSEMLCKDCDHNGNKKKKSGRDPQGAWRQEELTMSDGKPPVIKQI